MNLKDLQREQVEWVQRNFPGRPWQMPLMGVSEELGELNHALLKQWQGIRGSHEKHEKDAMDAVGDIVIFLSDLCTARGWDLGGIVQRTWDKVKERDWSETSKLASKER